MPFLSLLQHFFAKNVSAIKTERAMMCHRNARVHPECPFHGLPGKGEGAYARQIAMSSIAPSVFAAGRGWVVTPGKWQAGGGLSPRANGGPGVGCHPGQMAGRGWVFSSGKRQAGVQSSPLVKGLKCPSRSPLWKTQKLSNRKVVIYNNSKLKIILNGC